MTDISPARINIQQEETAYRAGVSESTLSRVGAATNFVNLRQYDSHAFHVNGLYSLAVGILGYDGIFPILFDVEITGLTMYNRVAGTSGTTTVDIHKFTDANTDAGTIFSTRPAIDSTAPNNAYMIRRELDNTNFPATQTGLTYPVFSTTDFSAGEALFFEIDSAMSGAEDLTLELHFRPR